VSDQTQSSAGKARRLARIVRRTTGRAVILPLDLIVPLGPVPGAENTAALIKMGEAAGIDAVLLRWGEAKRVAPLLSPDTGLLVRLTAGSAAGGTVPFEALVHSVDASISIGADGVCVDFKLGSDREDRMLAAVGEVCERAERAGLVVLVESVPIDATGQVFTDPEHIGWAARTAQELGADMVKVPNPGSTEAMRAIVRQCQIPIIVAGGTHAEPAALLATIDEALAGGAAGTAIGRNVICHDRPVVMQRAIVDLVHSGASLDAVLRDLSEPASVEEGAPS
jgi:fructose-bisphosphate aldolase, class I